MARSGWPVRACPTAAPGRIYDASGALIPVLAALPESAALMVDEVAVSYLAAHYRGPHHFDQAELLLLRVAACACAGAGAVSRLRARDTDPVAAVLRRLSSLSGTELSGLAAAPVADGALDGLSERFIGETARLLADDRDEDHTAL